MAKRKNASKPTTQVAETSPVTDNQVPESTAPAQESPQQAAPDPLQVIRERAKQMAAKITNATPKLCLCGCGGHTKGGQFIPGHNGKLLGRLVKEEREQAIRNQPLTDQVQ